MDHRQFHCKENNCNKSFARKEHLTRHERTYHSPDAVHTCHICQRAFNRSDSLLRHLTRHGGAFKSAPSGRTKRACVTCHAAKIKCDGNEKCSTCLKRGTDCIYRQQDGELNAPNPDHESGWQSPMPADQSRERQPSSPIASHSPNLNIPAGGLILNTHSALSTSLDGQSITRSLQAPQMPALGGNGNPPKLGSLMDWHNLKIRKDPPTAESDNAESEQDPTTEKYLQLYYTYFHYRWPIIHRASNAEENDCNILFLSMKMIGALLERSQQSKEYAITQHNKAVAQILPQLSRFTSQDTFQGSLSEFFCLAALLNIIFGLYYGTERVISRALMLRSMLICALREVGLFKPETAWADEKPGYFLPLRQVKEWQRQRLSVYLSKIDSYFGILRNQPALLMPEELHFTLPSTYSLWNSDGLVVWETRVLIEPKVRSLKYLSEMINESASDSVFLAEGPILIEDLQLCISAMQPSIWKLSNRGESSQGCEISIVLQKDTLRRRLDSLKEIYDRMAHQNSDTADFGDESYMPLRYYYGFEDQSQPGWQDIVQARVNGLLFDTLMLYHLFSLHLHAEIRSLSQSAKDQYLTPVQEASQVHLKAREQRQAAACKWAGTAPARQALCHAINVLHAHQNIAQNASAGLGLENKTSDPVAYIALSVAAVVIWAYCMFSKPGCVVCSSVSLQDASYDGSPIIDLTAWTNPGYVDEEKETWLEMSEVCRVQLNQVQLCQCNVGFFMGLFRAHLPDSWEVANTICPDLLPPS